MQSSCQASSCNVSCRSSEQARLASLVRDSIPMSAGHKHRCIVVRCSMYDLMDLNTLDTASDRFRPRASRISRFRHLEKQFAIFASGSKDLRSSPVRGIFRRLCTVQRPVRPSACSSVLILTSFTKPVDQAETRGIRERVMACVLR